MEHWTDDFEHSSITPENKEAFNTHMAKFPTEADAIADGYGLAKLKGVPFKMPEAMDKLPDDASRTDFTAQANKLLGIEHAADINGFADLDLKMGLAEGVVPDENLANAFKQWAVEKKIPKRIAQEMIGYHNVINAKATIAMKATADSDKLAAAKSTHEALVARPEFGSAEKVSEQSELVRRAVQNHVGLTPDEYEEFGKIMGDTMLTKNPVMARVMMKVLAPLAAEGNTDSGTGTPAAKEGTIKEQLPKTGKALGWDK